jgi:hypothetical protein
MILHDLFDWSNAGVGVLGLGFTLWAVVQATGAKTAATEARHAIYRRNASDDVRRLHRIASSLLTSIETEQYDLASHQARDFITDCLNVREHHRTRLGTDGGKLDVAFVLVRSISRELQRGTKQDHLIESAQRVVGAMSSLAGVLSRNSEVEEQ